MTQWRIILLILCGVLFGRMVLAAPPAGLFSEELDTECYDCIVSLTPASGLLSTSEARVTLEWDESVRAYLRVAITKSRITITAINASQQKVIGQVPSGITGTTPYTLIIMRRGDVIRLSRNDVMIFSGTVPRASGHQAGISLGKGWTATEEPRIQRLEPLVFTDDFMRGIDDAGPWKIQSGEWALQSAWDNSPLGNFHKFSNLNYAQNPFAWVGANAKGGMAICTTGETFWEDYTCNLAIRPGKDGAVGVLFNMPDEKNGLLVRWSPVNDQSQSGNRLLLLKVTNGVLSPTPLASSPGGYLPGQWYKISVISSPEGVRVLIDNRERIKLGKVTPWRGGVGLFVQGKNAATFDDIFVYGRSLNTDLLRESHESRVNARFQEDDNGMQDWSSFRSDWIAANGLPGHYWYRRDVFGDHAWIVLDVKPTALATGELWLGLNSDAQNPLTGYRAVAKMEGTPAKLSLTLYRDQTVLAAKTTEPLAAGNEYTFRFWRIGSRVRLEVDGDEGDPIAIEATDKTPVTGMRPFYRANGCFTTLQKSLVLSQNMLDYTFADAPTDWVNEGIWMPTIRWSCAPQWSFLSGWSRGDAAMWHKQRFTGDHAFEAFIGLKMEYPHERESYDDRYRDFCITICGDGKNPRSGYAGVYAASGEEPKRMLLLRNGVIVASQPLSLQFIPNKGTNHRSWFDLEMRKRGATVEFLVKFSWIKNANNEPEVLSLSYQDAQPIEGGIPAIWTSDNGISVARARLSFTTPPTPRTDPQVTISAPWYPDWININQPLKLDFADSYATNGKPVHLCVTPQEAPGNDAATTYKTDGSRITLSPKLLGNYWYQIRAIDNDNHTSPAFDLSVPVFNPALGRDDSHALVLYDFSEGEGKQVIDKSNVSPPANLTICDESTAQWAPRQGLNMRQSSRVMTMKTGSADKLLAIAKTRACTIEFWSSTDTLYAATAPMNWTSCLFSWDYPTSSDGTKRNLTVGQNVKRLLVCPRGGQFHSNPSVALNEIFHTGLQHTVITWNGDMTYAYIDGVKVGEKSIIWNVDQMTPGSYLILGNSSDSCYAYLGTFYLFAIHDRCFTDAEVQRHFQAGPTPQKP